MRVVAPYTDEAYKSESRSSLLADMPNAELVDLTSDPDGYGYWKLFRSCWEHQQDFVIVEHDMVVPKGALKSFIDCPEPWCTFAYRCHNETSDLFAYALGLVRYRQALMETYPRVAIYPAMWTDLDVAVNGYLGEHLKPHVHGEAKHLHLYLPVERFTITKSGKPKRLPSSTKLLTS